MQTKEFLLSGWVFLGFLLLLQCKSEMDNALDTAMKSASKGATIITGNIRNRDVYPNSKYIRILVPQLSVQGGALKLESPINKDGTFSFVIDLVRPQEVAIVNHVDFLYLLPGDSIHVELDFKRLSVAKLSGGKSADLSRDFHNYFNFLRYEDYHIGTQALIDLSWDEIRKILDKKRRYNRENRQTFLLKNKVGEEVVFLSEAMIELEYYSALVNITNGRKNIYHKEIMNEQKLINEVQEAAVKYFSKGLYSKAHFSFISAAYETAARLVYPLGDDTPYSDWAKKVAKTDTIRNFLVAKRAGYALLKKNLNEFETLSAHITHEYLLDRLINEYMIVRANMLNPENISASILRKPTDFANNITVNNNPVAQTVDINKGNVIVINIWANWCRPCHDVLLQFKPLVEEFAGKKVYFSFLCFSGLEQKAVDSFHKTGLDESSNHFCTPDEAQYLFKTFSPFGLPYGILVNRQGVVVDYGFHLRPGELLKEKINLLLEQDRLINSDR